MTLEFKFKVTANSTEPGSTRFAIVPKNLEVTNFKMMRGDEELEMEQMMIQSVINI